MQSSPRPRLLNDEFDPITYTIVFFNASLSVDADELKSWRTELFGNDAVDRRALDEELPTMLHELEPIVYGVTGRELLVTTANPEWTALCGAIRRC